MQTEEQDQKLHALKERFLDLIEGFDIQQLFALQQALATRPEIWGDELTAIQAEFDKRRQKSRLPPIPTAEHCMNPYADDYYPTAS